MATFMANPYAPRKEWLSLTTKAPGSLSFRTAMAVDTGSRLEAGRRAMSSASAYLPCSREMSALYQNRDVSCTNFTVSVLLPKSGGEIRRLCDQL